jgi:hypothetical protein
VHDNTGIYDKVLAGMTMASTIAGTMMAATAITRHIKQA